MAKADLQAAQMLYDEIMATARVDEAEGQYEKAISTAMRAWAYVEEMMKYERRWEQREFKSVSCIDTVIRLAPSLLHTRALAELRSLLSTRKSIDKHATDDLAERCETAHNELTSVYQLLDYLEQHRAAPLEEIVRSLGGSPKNWRSLTDQLVCMGLLTHVEREGGSPRLRLTTTMDGPVRSKCPECGLVVVGRREQFWRPHRCTTCGKTTSFVIVGAIELGEGAA
jgi:hypothetical protein